MDDLCMMLAENVLENCKPMSSENGNELEVFDENDELLQDDYEYDSLSDELLQYYSDSDDETTKGMNVDGQYEEKSPKLPRELKEDEQKKKKTK